MPLISFYRFLENKGNDRQLKRLSHDCHIMRGGGGRGGGGGGGGCSKILIRERILPVPKMCFSIPYCRSAL